MQQNFRLNLLMILAFSLLSACGGGSGGSTDSNTGNSGSPAAAPSWTAGTFAAESQFKDYCAAPRSGRDPFNGGNYPDKAGTAMHEKMWLRSWSNRTYLWFSEIPDPDPVNYDVESYFALLKTTAVTDSGVAKDQFHFTEDTADYQQQSQSGVSSGYGIEWYAASTRAPRSFTVAFTEPSSPAALAGIKRGDVLLEVDGVDFINVNTSAGVNTLNAGLFPSASGEQHSFKFRTQANTEVTYQIRSADITSSPVQNVKVINTSSGPVGYMQFNSYIVPAQTALINAVNQFNNAAVSELVVDLRYNGGGLLALAGQLGYMVTGPDIIQSRYFERLQFNSKYPNTNPVTGSSLSPTPFYDREINYESNTLTNTRLPNLNLNRIFVLTTDDTCSASEAFMNALRGIDVEVIQIGGKTCGKPYGFYPQDNCGTTYFTIQFSGINYKGFGDYADGFKPSTNPVFAADVKGCPVSDDFSKALGDPAEDMLQVALHYINTASCLTLAGSGSSKAVGSLSTKESAVHSSVELNGLAVKDPSAAPLDNSIRQPITDNHQ